MLIVTSKGKKQTSVTFTAHKKDFFSFIIQNIITSKLSKDILIIPLCSSSEEIWIVILNYFTYYFLFCGVGIHLLERPCDSAGNQTSFKFYQFSYCAFKYFFC